MSYQPASLQRQTNQYHSIEESPDNIVNYTIREYALKIPVAKHSSKLQQAWNAVSKYFCEGKKELVFLVSSGLDPKNHGNGLTGEDEAVYRQSESCPTASEIADAQWMLDEWMWQEVFPKVPEVVSTAPEVVPMVPEVVPTVPEVVPNPLDKWLFSWILDEKLPGEEDPDCVNQRSSEEPVNYKGISGNPQSGFLADLSHLQSSNAMKDTTGRTSRPPTPKRRRVSSHPQTSTSRRLSV